MTIVRIQKSIIDKATVEHFSKHKIEESEVQLVVSSDCLISEGHSGRKILTSKVGNRIISVIVEMWSNKLRVKTARDASDKERDLYHEFKKTKTNT